MANEYLQGLALADEKMAAIIRKRHSDWFATIEMALGEINRGMDELFGTRTAFENDLEKARVLLAIRAFRSLRAALSLLGRGYNQQAGGLIRMTMEDLLIVEDIATHPPTLEALLYGKRDDKYRLGRGELHPIAMARRISPKTQEAWKEEYDSLSVFATHPKSRGIGDSKRAEPRWHSATHTLWSLRQAATVFASGIDRETDNVSNEDCSRDGLGRR